MLGIAAQLLARVARRPYRYHGQGEIGALTGVLITGLCSDAKRGREQLGKHGWELSAILALGTNINRRFKPTGNGKLNSQPCHPLEFAGMLFNTSYDYYLYTLPIHFSSLNSFACYLKTKIDSELHTSTSGNCEPQN